MDLDFPRPSIRHHVDTSIIQEIEIVLATTKVDSEPRFSLDSPSARRTPRRIGVLRRWIVSTQRMVLTTLAPFVTAWSRSHDGYSQYEHQTESQ